MSKNGKDVMTDWKWKGSRWWKFDFHAHTPASIDYGKGSNQSALKERTPKEWLLDYMRAGIDCVAITDHNSGVWIDQLKEAEKTLAAKKPDGHRPIYLFPGVEISVIGGVHLLAVLGCEKTTADIDSLLGAAGFSGTKGSSDAVTSKSFAEVVHAIANAGGIAIPAHVDERNGLFQLSGTTLQQALDCKDIFAMELVDTNSQKPQAYTDRNLCWTEVIGSDAHHPNGASGKNYPGSRFTWVKMGSPNIEGLRLALLDGSLSVRRSDQGGEDPNEHAPMVLESIEISQARYLGRPKPFVAEFNPWLNAIIGGRGTGKSTLVEFLRIALRREAELPDALKEEFEKYRRVYPNRKDGGLLTQEATINVVYRKDGSRFRVRWSPSGDIEPIEQDVDGAWRRAEGDIRQRFPVRIYSQKQIFQLAKQPLALLFVIDEAPEVYNHAWVERQKAEETRFLSLRAKARELKAGLAEDPRLRGELADVKRKLAVFEQAGHAEVLKNYQQRSRQHREIDEWEKTWKDAGEKIRSLSGRMVPDLFNESLFDSSSPADAELRSFASSLVDQLTALRDSLDTLASKAEEATNKWQEHRAASLWEQSVAASATAYKELKDSLEQQGAGDPNIYGELVQRRQTIEQRQKELEDRSKQVDDVEKQAKDSLTELRNIRRELTLSRKKFLTSILRGNNYVTIEVAPYQAREAAATELRRLLQREQGFDKDIGSPDGGGLLGEIYGPDDEAEVADPRNKKLETVENKGPDDEAEVVDPLEMSLETVKDKIRKMASDNNHDIEIADARFASHISHLPPETIDRLDMWFPEDALTVQYSPTGDGSGFRAIEEGSPGQKTAALLAFLLSYGEEPLILDQPEDDLDNQLIYELIVKQLRDVKRRRQVIVVTHNANIVVNGDAELVTALAARGGATQKDCDGTLQEKVVRQKVCTIMEGGNEAFEQRYRRIALEGRHA